MGSIPATGQIRRVAICIACCNRGRRTCTCGRAAELASTDSIIYTEPAPTRSRPKPSRIVETARAPVTRRHPAMGPAPASRNGTLGVVTGGSLNETRHLHGTTAWPDTSPSGELRAS